MRVDHNDALGSGLIDLTEMAFDMTRYARKNPQGGFFPRSRVLTQQIAVRSIVLWIGWICPEHVVASP